MKKKILYGAVLAFCLGLVSIAFFNENETEKIRNQHAEFLKDHPFNKAHGLTKKERKAKGLPPNAYFEQEYLNEINPRTGRTHPENIFKVQQELNSSKLAERVPGDTSDNPWVERGPNNVGGRTRVVLFDPNDSSQETVYAGGVSGGLWKNTAISNPNSVWTQVGISENLSISCITVDPNNSNIWYVGTGESYTGNHGIGNGIWKTSDGGNYMGKYI